MPLSSLAQAKGPFLRDSTHTHQDPLFFRNQRASAISCLTPTYSSVLCRAPQLFAHIPERLSRNHTLAIDEGSPLTRASLLSQGHHAFPHLSSTIGFIPALIFSRGRNNVPCSRVSSQHTPAKEYFLIKQRLSSQSPATPMSFSQSRV